MISDAGQPERDDRGRFAQGNRAAAGRRSNHAERVAELRQAAIDAVSTEDMRALICKLRDLALGGNVPAAREVLDRVLGRPVEADLLERLDELEAIAESVMRDRR